MAEREDMLRAYRTAKADWSRAHDEVQSAGIELNGAEWMVGHWTQRLETATKKEREAERAMNAAARDIAAMIDEDD